MRETKDDTTHKKNQQDETSTLGDSEQMMCLS